MQLTCPHCQFSKEIPADKLPAEPTKVTCPQCKGSFALPQREATPTQAAGITCPACHTEQIQSSTCSSCGLIFSKFRQPQQQELAPAVATELSLDDRPKAGFWLRFVAVMIDGFLVFLMQVIFSMLLMLIGSDGFNPQGTIAILVQLFSLILSFFYWIFFTGYCGQTPGKMLLRIKVVRADGESIGYGKAFYREVVGKFISGIILCIGYLMAAFDDQKQALHDRMARTYVIKL